MTLTARRLITCEILHTGGALLLLVGCATARQPEPVARMVPSTEWGTIVDCVVLSARASEFYAEVDSGGISVTPGFTPLAQNRSTSRAGVVGSVRVARVPEESGLRITTDAFHWDTPTVGRRLPKPASATRALAHQLDAQCLAAYPVAASD